MCVVNDKYLNFLSPFLSLLVSYFVTLSVSVVCAVETAAYCASVLVSLGSAATAAVTIQSSTATSADETTATATTATAAAEGGGCAFAAAATTESVWQLSAAAGLSHQDIHLATANGELRHSTACASKSAQCYVTHIVDTGIFLGQDAFAILCRKLFQMGYP